MMRDDFKIRICDADRKTQCGKIDIDEPADRAEDRDHVQQAADDEKPYSDSSDNGRRADCIVDTPGIHKAKNKLGEYMVNVAERAFE